MSDVHTEKPSPTAPSDPKPKQSWAQWILRRVIWVAVLYAAYCTFLYFTQTTLIFPAYIPNSRDPIEIHADGRTIDKLITTTADGGTVPAYFYPANPLEPDTPKPVVIFFHGNAELVGEVSDFAYQYNRRGCSVLVPEYRGYGEAAGEPSQEGIVTDMVAFYDQLIQRPDVDPNHIVFHGRSLGGGIASATAAHRKPAAIILQSTFTSAADMAQRYFAPSFLCKHPFRSDEVLQSMPDLPVLIFHGTQDNVIPVSHGRALAEMLPQARYVEYDSNHDSLPGQKHLEDYWREIEAFLKTVIPDNSAALTADP